MSIKIAKSGDIATWPPVIHSDTFNAEGERIYPQNLKLGESGYRLDKRGWVIQTTVMEFKEVDGCIPEIKLDMKLVFMPFFRSKCKCWT
jgi:hypothetical protein